MSGNEAKVLLDLNYPGFQGELFDLDVAELKKTFKTLKKLRILTWNEVFRDHGLKWEELKSVQGKFTVRLSQSYRAVVVRDGAFMRFQSLHQDHDGAYGKK
jgi:hypothetical protein